MRFLFAWIPCYTSSAKQQNPVLFFLSTYTQYSKQTFVQKNSNDFGGKNKTNKNCIGENIFICITIIEIKIIVLRSNFIKCFFINKYSATGVNISR